MDRDEFARSLGFRDADALDEASEPYDDEYGLTSYITCLPDGRWAVWDEDDMAANRVSYYNTREEAEDSINTAYEDAYEDRYEEE